MYLRAFWYYIIYLSAFLKILVYFKGALVIFTTAESLARFLEHAPEWVRGRRVLELGSGAHGLVGLVAAELGADATLTDLPQVTRASDFWYFSVFFFSVLVILVY